MNGGGGAVVTEEKKTQYRKEILAFLLLNLMLYFVQLRGDNGKQERNTF